jgi:hypothetical protein
MVNKRPGGRGYSRKAGSGPAGDSSLIIMYIICAIIVGFVSIMAMNTSQRLVYTSPGVTTTYSNPDMDAFYISIAILVGIIIYSGLGSFNVVKNDEPSKILIILILIVLGLSFYLFIDHDSSGLRSSSIRIDAGIIIAGCLFGCYIFDKHKKSI